MPGGSKSGLLRSNVRVVVVGDRSTGKSSLIVAAATETFPDEVPPVLPPTRLPADYYPDHVPVTIIDTSSSLEFRGKLAEELKRADAVVLTYACDQPSTLNRLDTFWLHELRRLEIKVPVIVVGCKLDRRERDLQLSVDQIMAPIMQKFREIETCIECSASNLIQVPDVFYCAQKAVLHPTAPLFDYEIRSLKPRCVRALKRIFVLCDHDMDDALNNEELNEFQVKCFDAALQPAEIVGVKRVVDELLPGGVNELGLTLTGFLFLHSLFIERGRIETTWNVLRKFGYNDEIKLKDDYLVIPFKRSPDQSVELTSEAMEFLKGVFSSFDTDKDGILQNSELEDLFSTAPESPWEEAPYNNAVERTPLGGLSLSGFLCEWALMTLLNPTQSLANLRYIGYNCNAASALQVTRKRSVDLKKQKRERNVYQCFVFGPKSAGKSALLKSFLGRPFSENYTPTSDDWYVVNVVNRPGGTNKTLVLREIPEDGVKKLLFNRESLATCDIAAFVYDREYDYSFTWEFLFLVCLSKSRTLQKNVISMLSCSDEYSLIRASELLMDVARLGEKTRSGVPCLLIAAKDDLDTYPMAIRDSEKICQYMGIDAPVHVSAKERDLNHVFLRIINAAEHPNLNVPETEEGRSKKRYRSLVNHSLVFISVSAAVAVVGLAAYRSFAARKNTSN